MTDNGHTPATGSVATAAERRLPEPPKGLSA